MPNNSSRGFTLIELLITITIIAVLSAIGLVTYSSFIARSRDSKRQSDLKLIQSALEEYHSDYIYYPLLLTDLNTGIRKYLNNIPSDPKTNTSTPYQYNVYKADGTSCTVAADCIKYCLFASIEVATPSSDLGCTSPFGYNYGLTRP